MRTNTTTLSLALSAFAVAAFASAPASAADPAYVGTWASDLAQCKVPQERQEAPLVLSKDGYDQYETRCKFTSVEGADSDILAEIPGHAFRELADASHLAVELPRETIKVLE